MRNRQWNRTGTPITFTELGFGAAPLGNLYRAISEPAAQAILARAWEGGVRYIDTAPLYGLGLSETRLNHFLRNKPRESYVLSSKIGRILHPCAPADRDGIGKWFDVPARTEVYDYSYDGVMRSVAFSLERLGIDRIDILYAHDLDIFNHKSPSALDARLSEFMSGGYRALTALRDQGVIAAFGAGVNEWQPCQWLLDRGDFDLFLLAGRYTLLEQGALGLLNAAQARGVGVIIGGPYNSGILASGPRPGAFYNYDPAPAAIMARTAQLQAVCQSHNIRLVDAAFQFPLQHPAVVSVIPGGQGVAEIDSNLAAAQTQIPPALWSDLKSQGLLHPDAPTEIPKI